MQGGTLQVTVPAGTYVPGTRWRIASGSSVTGSFTSVVFSDTSRGLRIEQSANAIDIVLPCGIAIAPTMVPSSSTWALIVLLLALLVPAALRLRQA